MAQWGSWVVAGIPAIGLLVAGRFNRVGWLICLTGQVATVTYGCLTGQWGFVGWSPLYAGVYLWNWWNWRRKGKNMDAKWTKSTRCESNGCVEVGLSGDHVLVRDSKEACSPVLRFTRQEWDAFVAGAKAGEFDL